MTPRSPKGRRRPSPPPPALLFSPGELLPGSAVLGELREPAGVALWQAVHDVYLWAGAAPHERALLFAPAALARRQELLRRGVRDPELFALLGRLSGALLRDPAEADAAEVAE
ncbi:MAG TPA: hypothetical protein VGR37_20165, partial [Longimicrobiaceae bacterium]|nr:hypothetical protein [Longimicrobiaceae bacterium]